MYDENMLDFLQDDYVTLTSDNGEDADFSVIAGIPYQGHYYAILQPVELLEGMGEDEALVFEVTSVDGQTSFGLVLDDEILDAVFAEYYKLCNEANNQG